MTFRVTMDDNTSFTVPENAVLTCSITHGTATKWVEMPVRKLRKYVNRQVCLLPPGKDLRHSIRSIEPKESP